MIRARSWPRSAAARKVHAVIAGQDWEIADGGFVDWVQRLTGHRKERLLIGGMGLDRLAMVGS